MDEESALEKKRFTGLRHLFFCLCVLASLFPYACLVTYALWLLYGNKDPSRLWLPIVYVTFVSAWIVPLYLRRESLKLRVLRGLFVLLAPVMLPLLLKSLIFASMESRNAISRDLGERLFPLIRQYQQANGQLPASPLAVAPRHLQWEAYFAKPLFFANGDLAFDPNSGLLLSNSGLACYWDPVEGIWTTVDYYGDGN